MENTEIKPFEEIELNNATTLSEENSVSSSENENPSFIKKWGSLGVLSLALAIIIIDTTILNVSLSAIIKDLKTDIQGIQWVITAYALTLSALTITGGRLGDFFGRKKMFVLGAVIFAVGSFTASISHNVAMLLLGEALIEGVGAALMMPATASLLVSNFHGRERGIAFGVWGGVAGASSAVGPILGGFLTKYYSWRWGFRINLFVALLLVIGSVIVKESGNHRIKAKLDIVGVILSSVGLLGVVFGIIESSKYGWFFAKTPFVIGDINLSVFGLSIVPIVIILGAMFLNLFYVWERKIEKRGKTPLVTFDIFKIRPFWVGVLTTGIISLGQIGILFTLPVFLQGVLHLDALATGIALLPLSLTILIMAPISGFLTTKISHKYIIVAGLFLDVIGVFILQTEISTTATAATLIPGLIIFGVGMGMAMSQISNITLSAVDVRRAGEASGISSTLRQVGSSFGTAIIGAVLLSVLYAKIISGLSQSSIIPANVKPQILNSVNNQSSSIEFGGNAQFGQNVPLAIKNEIEKTVKIATVDASKTSLLYAMFFAFLGFLLSLILPRDHREK